MQSTQQISIIYNNVLSFCISRNQISNYILNVVADILSIIILIRPQTDDQSISFLFCSFSYNRWIIQFIQRTETKFNCLFKGTEFLTKQFLTSFKLLLYFSYFIAYSF